MNMMPNFFTNHFPNNISFIDVRYLFLIKIGWTDGKEGRGFSGLIVPVRHLLKLKPQEYREKKNVEKFMNGFELFPFK